MIATLMPSHTCCPLHITTPTPTPAQAANEGLTMSVNLSNKSIDTDVLSAGFARLLSGGHLQR